ncbi:E3 ubiquitin-protein ligase TRIM71-like [Pocillopora verrucosa]|uniref:E3 ubiquitin-protein ligase TRIM71-like n=1 Tax=Pocillopora verrucosa TaxID=203993 RepID=UPI003342C790
MFDLFGYLHQTQGSVVEGLDQNFQAGIEAELLICPKTSEGEIRNTRHKDRVEIHLDPADQVRSLATSEKEDGNFQAKFVAKVPGTYKIEVKINGQKLARSPFSILVKAQELNVIGKLDVQGEMLQGPAGISVNSKGVIAVADREGHCILVFDEKGTFVRKIGSYGDEEGQLKNPVDVTFVNDDEILVADESDFNKFGDSGPERLDHPLSCVCYEEKFIVTEKNNNCVKVFDEKGQFLYKFGEKENGDGQMDQLYGLCVDKHNNVFLCDGRNNRVQQFTLEGTFTGKTSSNIQFGWPWSVTPMLDDRIVVTDYEKKEVYILK